MATLPFWVARGKEEAGTLLIMVCGPLDCLPVFPLPGVVFFPHTMLPLHIYEPKYRIMTRDCLEHSLPLAVGLPGSDVMGVGRILRHQLLEGGRYNIVLEGVGRAFLEEELSNRNGYRRFRARMIATQSLDMGKAGRSLDVIRACLPGLGVRWPEPARALSDLLDSTSDPGIFSDRVASAIFNDPQERQSLLETAEAAERLDRVVERILELVHASDQHPLEVH